MKIMLLAGGSSSEREVSFTSGKAIFDALSNLGHSVNVIDPSSGQSILDESGGYPEVLPKLTKTDSNDVDVLKAMFTNETVSECNLVFLALHGGDGENGKIQALLDQIGVKYTGSSSVASAKAMDKASSKDMFRSIDVRTPEFELFCSMDIGHIEEYTEQITAKFSFPLIIKPNSGGSTVGLTCVKNPNEIPDALKLAALEDSDVLVEQYIKGRELTVAVVGRRPFSVVEIIPKNELYDYEAKYTKGMSEYIAPAEINAGLAQALRDDAVKVCEKVGTRGLARVDFIWIKEREYYCLEVNTLPGLTSLSLAPMSVGCEDVSFKQLVKMIVESAK